MISLDLLHQLIPMTLLDDLAIQYDVNTVNQVKLPGQAVFVCLLNGLLNHPELTLRLLEEEYEKQTGQHCDHSSFGKRISKMNPEFFSAIHSNLYSKITAESPQNDLRALKIRFVDATTVTLSSKLLKFGLFQKDSNGDRRHIKSIVELSDDGLPNLLHVCKKPSEHNDVVAIGDQVLAAAVKNDLWIFDAGFDDRVRLFKLHQKGSYWLTPQSEQKVIVDRIIKVVGPDILPSEAPGKNDKKCIVHRVELGHFLNNMKRLAPNLDTMPVVLVHCHLYDGRKKQWKRFALMTNLPLSASGDKLGYFTFDEVVDLYGKRWDIEIFFRFLKGNLKLEHLTSRSENGVKIMLIMSIIAALLLVWYKAQTKIDRGWRSVMFWFADDVRSWTAQVIAHMIIIRSG